MANAYATVQDIRDEIPNVPITASSKPNEVQVGDEVVPEIEAYIHMRLQQVGYTTPITVGASPQSFQILKKLTQHGSAAETLRRAFGSGPAVDEQQKMFDLLLQAIIENGLPDVPLDTTEQWFIGSNFGDVDRAFTRGQVF